MTEEEHDGLLENPHNHLPYDAMDTVVRVDPDWKPHHHHHGFKGHVVFCPTEELCILVISDPAHWIHPWDHTH